MTTVTNEGKGGKVWSLAQAKAHLSEVVERSAIDGPQTITRNGKRAAVMVSALEWDRKTMRRGSLIEFLASSPLRGSGVDLDRLHGGPRELGW